MTGNKSTKAKGAAPETSTPSSSPMGSVYLSLVSPIASAIYIVCFLNLLYRACTEAYNIRLYAINEFGRVIHEFDHTLIIELPSIYGITVPRDFSNGLITCHGTR